MVQASANISKNTQVKITITYRSKYQGTYHLHT